MLRQVVLLAILASASAFYYTEVKTDKEYLTKQKKIYNLLFHVAQPELTTELFKEGTAYDIKANIESYTNKEAVEKFLHLYEHGLLPRGEVCSLLYKSHAIQMISLIRLFYYAKDFETFSKTAAWARAHINSCIYSQALYMAVVRRPDTMFIQLPHPYEIYPFLFFNSEVMEKAHHAKVYGQPGQEYIIPANYSGWYLSRGHDPEHKMNYFTEDIGWNSFYYYLKLDNPFFMKSKEFNMPDGYRGEEYLYSHKQIFARYILERLANDLDRVEDFDWHEPFHCGYYPTMTYHNGLPLPQRPPWSRFPYHKIKYIRDTEEYETRILAAIDSGYAYCEEGPTKLFEKNDANYIGNLIEGNADSCNKYFYGSIDVYSKKILGFNMETNNDNMVYPSVLEQWIATMRDPAFYRLCKRITDYYIRYNARLKPHKKEELIYPEYKIDTVEVDKLQTFFEQFDASFSNALIVENFNEAEKLVVKARQWRLNHKHFNVNININSEKAGKACVRLFLGPKYDSHHKLLNFFDTYKYYYEIDNFIITLNAGANKVKRNSHDFYFLLDDQMPVENHYKKVVQALESGENFNYQQRLYGFPERLLLPKGKREGLPLQLFVYVNPVEKEITYKSRVFGDYSFDNRNFGFPLDRTLKETDFHGPNMFFKEVMIYHKDEHEFNLTH